jgi:pimeloyl-ACP methyl ester carboxylesterase
MTKEAHMPKIKAGSINLEYYVEGSGPPLLMIMGFGGQASSWSEPFLERLRPHFTVIRFSNRGTGESDRPAEPTTIRMMADDAAALLEALGIGRAHVLGASMGGMIAQELALHHPALLNALVLCCTTSGGAGHVAANAEVFAMLMPSPGLSREDQIRKAWPAMCTPGFIEERLDFMEMMLQTSLINPTPIETIMKQMAAVQGFDAYDRLGAINAPTLVIHGDADVLVPMANAHSLQERIPGSQLAIIPGVGHMISWEKPAEAARVITEFLSRAPARAGA